LDLKTSTAATGEGLHIGPTRKPGERLSDYRFRVARFCGFVALATGVTAAALVVFTRYIGGIDVPLGLLFFLFIGLPLVFFTAAIGGIAQLIGSLWARRRERNSPPPVDINSLIERAKSATSELAVHGGSPILAASLVTAIGGVLLPIGHVETELALLVGGILLLSMGLIMLLGAVATFGRPKIILTHAGFSTPLSPFVHWSEVHGIHLQANSRQGQLLSHTLSFRIPTLPERIAEFAFFHRILHWIRRSSGKEKFFVLLQRTDEPPELIYLLARRLWTQSTGRDYLWNPNVSDRCNEALRHPGPSTVRIIHEEMQRSQRKLSWTVAGGLACFILYLAWRLLH
jgi:hypothetical protein